MGRKKSTMIALLFTAVFSNSVAAQDNSPFQDRAIRTREKVPMGSAPRRPPVEPNYEGIKLAVTQYFDWLKRAETDGALPASSMKPMSVLPESQEFLESKNEVLQATEFSNELNGVKIENHSVKLVFQRISLNKTGNIAQAEVVEQYERKYAYFAEPAVGEILHAITVRFERGLWEIVDDTLINAPDASPKRIDKVALMDAIHQEATLRRTAEQQLLFNAGITAKFLSQERTRLAQQGLDARQIEERLGMIVNQKMNAESEKSLSIVTPDTINPLMLVNRGYNRTAAKAYIDKWWNRRNPAWGDFDSLGGDCTNWVSQIINAGGVPEDKTGSYQWYWDNMKAPRTSPPYTRSSSWAGVDELWNYVKGNTANNGPLGPQGQSWSNSSGLTQMTTGDFIQLWKSSGWFHTYGVYDGQWVNLKPWWCPWCKDDWRYKVRVTSHFANRHRDDLDAVASFNPTRRYVRITGWYQP